MKAGRPPKYIINGKARYGSYQHYCIDCGKEICRQAQRCRSCSKKGHFVSDKQREKLRMKRFGENNPNWKGKNITYSGIHTWIRRKLKKEKCYFCGSQKNLDYANKSGEYKRDMNDWLCLCRSCHMKYDYNNGTRKINRKTKKIT